MSTLAQRPPAACRSAPPPRSRRTRKSGSPASTASGNGDRADGTHERERRLNADGSDDVRIDAWMAPCSFRHFATFALPPSALHHIAPSPSPPPGSSGRRNFDRQVVRVGNDQFGAGAELDHAELLPAGNHLAGPQVADDPPGDGPGNLPHDQPAMRRRFLLQADPRVFVPRSRSRASAR